MNEEATARQAARQAAERERREGQQREFAAARAAKAHEAIVRELRAGFFAADPAATPADFEAALPALLDERRRRGALEGDEAARLAA